MATPKKDAEKIVKKKAVSTTKKVVAKKVTKKVPASAAAKPAKKASVKKARTSVSKKGTATEESEKDDAQSSRYYEAVGRRKRATARVRLFTKGEKEFSVNSQKHSKYFPSKELREIADGALRKMKVIDKFSVTVKVKGGGMTGQAEAIRHGTARALIIFNPDFRKRLKRVGYLRRDPREKERRKFGLKKARRAPQWSKR